MSTELPKVVRFLRDELKFAVRAQGRVSDYEFYLIDLSSWKLRLSDRTPLIRITSRQLEACSTDEQLAGIRAVIQSQGFQQRTPILLLEGTSPALREAARLQLPYCILIDEQDAEQLTARPANDRRVLNLICEQLPLGFLSPYEISAPVTGSRFFGREHEIRTILNHPETSYVLVGVRRIGKSSVLLELRRRLVETGNEAVFFFDCSDFHSADDFVQAVVTEVDIRRRQRMTMAKFPRFLQLQSHLGRRPLTFLLDEVDRLIDFDRQNRWDLLAMLRSSANQRFCRYILTGYRRVVEESLDERSPLYNFATRLPLGNLLKDDIQQLIQVPMENLGVTLDRRGDLINQVFQQTAGHPNFVQFYCHTMIQLMDRESRRHIGPADLALVYGDPEFERYVFRTFTANTTDLEKAIVYDAVLDHEGQFTVRDLDVALRKRRVRATATQIEQALDNLRMAGIVDKEGKSFVFSIPILPRMLKDHYDLDFLFTKAKEDGKLTLERS